MTTLRNAIVDLYRQVDAPDWAAPNLDGLADVLRDLSWCREGVVEVVAPAGLPRTEAERLDRVLRAAERESAGGPRPVRVIGPPAVS